MKKVFALSIALILCVMSALVGCSSSEGNSELAAFAEKQQDAVEAISMTGFGVECSAEGDSLVYTYKYGSDLLTEEEAQSMLGLLDTTYSTMLDAVQVEVPSCTSIIIKVVDNDGKSLAEKEYK